jgi:nucleoporin NUP82
MSLLTPERVRVATFTLVSSLMLHSSVPSSYIHSLECFISAKQEFLSEASTSKTISTLFDYQRKYVSALVKQLPSGTIFPAISRPVVLHPPAVIKSKPARQGPFLLQPSPLPIMGSEGGDATDILYMTFRTDGKQGIDDDDSEAEHLGLVLIAYQDGKIDVCLDVEKVEAVWDTRQNVSRGLPMLTVYETIDLGIVSTLRSLIPKGPTNPLDLLQSNSPAFFRDPIQDETVYIYHAFGVHALSFERLLAVLSTALREEEPSADLQLSVQTDVSPLLSTFSVERRYLLFPPYMPANDPFP